MRPRNLLLVLCALALLPTPAHADGMMLPRQTDWERQRERALINEPAQKAAILYTNGRERLIISPSYQGPPGDFAWVVPVPQRPQVKILGGALFHELARIVEPVPPQRAVFAAGAAKAALPEAPVVVLERKTVGAYDVSVLAATDGDALQKWLDQNGYFLPPSARAPLAVYVRKRWTFVACRVKQPASAHGLQNGVLAPLSLTFPTKQIVYPMRLSASNPAHFDLLLYLLLPVTDPMPTPLTWPGAQPPPLSLRALPPLPASYPTLASLERRSLNLAWLKTTIDPSSCTRDYTWNAPILLK